MRHLVATSLAALALGACTTYGSADQAAADDAPPIDQTDECGASAVQDYLGKSGNAENQAALAAAAKAEFRWIPYGSIITRDYRLTRLNVELDENNVIKRIACF